MTAKHALGAEFELFRIDGDGFAAVAAAPIAPDDLFAAAERTRRAIEAGAPVTASFGIAFARPGETDSRVVVSRRRGPRGSWRSSWEGTPSLTPRSSATR